MKPKNPFVDSTNWVRVDEWVCYLKQHGVKVEVGPWDNWTDGGVHYYLTLGDEVLNFQGNRWGWGRDWDNAMQWLAKRGVPITAEDPPRTEPA